MKRAVAGLSLAVALSGCVQEPPERSSLPEVAGALDSLPTTTAQDTLEDYRVYRAESVEDLRPMLAEDINQQRPLSISFGSTYLFWRPDTPDSGMGRVMAIINPIIFQAEIGGQTTDYIAGFYLDPESCQDGVIFVDDPTDSELSKWSGGQINVRSEVATPVLGDGLFALRTERDELVGLMLGGQSALRTEFLSSTTGQIIGDGQQFESLAPDCGPTA